MPALVALIVLATVIFGKLWSPADIKRFQKELKTNADNLDLAMKSCATLTASERTAWENTLANIHNYVATDFGWVTTTLPDGSTQFWGGDRAVADDGERFARELLAQGQILTGHGCALVAPIPDIDKPKADAQKTLDTVATIVKYTSVAAVFVGSAYVVGKIVEFIPKPTRRTS